MIFHPIWVVSLTSPSGSSGGLLGALKLNPSESNITMVKEIMVESGGDTKNDIAVIKLPAKGQFNADSLNPQVDVISI